MICPSCYGLGYVIFLPFLGNDPKTGFCKVCNGTGDYDYTREEEEESNDE